MPQGWFKIKQAAHYCDFSERTLRTLLKQGLRYSKLPSGTILIKTEWIDEFIEQFEVDEGKKVEQFVDSVFQEIR